MDQTRQLLILTDQNPLFVQFDCQNPPQGELPVDAAMLQVNSPNHGQRGQNVLRGDGQV